MRTLTWWSWSPDTADPMVTGLTSSGARTSSLTDLRPPDLEDGARSWQNKKLPAPARTRPGWSLGRRSLCLRARERERELHNKSNVITFTRAPLSVHARHCRGFKICLSAVLVQKSCFLFDRNRWDVYSRDKHCILKGQFIPLKMCKRKLQISSYLTGPHWCSYLSFRVFHYSTLFSKY